VRTYGDDLAQLCLGIARLVHTAAQQSDLIEPWRVLAARDAVLQGLTAAYGTLAGPLPASPRRSQAARQPVQFLSSAMAEHPRLAPTLSASEGLGLTGTDQYWSLAAGGAVGFEEHVSELRYLDARDGWTAVADLTRVAQAVPLLDADLAARIRAWNEGADPRRGGMSRAGWISIIRHLEDPVRAHALRSGAHEVLQIIDALDRSDAAAGIHAQQHRLLLVRSASDVPEALTRLAYHLSLSDQLGMRDVVICAAALRRVAGSAGEALSRTRWSTVEQLLSPRLAGLQASLAEVASYRSRLASVTQAEHVEAQARSLGDLLHLHRGPEPVRLAAESVDRLGPTVGAFTRAIDRSSRNGTLLIPWDAAGRRSEGGFWQPALDPEAPPLRGIRAAAGNCRCEARSLPGLVSILQQEHGFQLERDRVAQLTAGATRTVDRVAAARTVDGDSRTASTPPRRWRTCTPGMQATR